MSWSVRPLNQVADFVLGKMLDQAKNKGDLLPYLANINVRWGDFDLNALREMRFESHELERFSLKRGDIVMCEGGEPGRCALWKGEQSGMMFQKALHRIRPHACLDSRFLYYAFLNLRKSNGFAPYFTGATIKHLPREQLAKIEVRFPGINTQKAIASILENYDDLIAINKRRIQLLGDAARRLYREVESNCAGGTNYFQLDKAGRMTYDACTIRSIVTGIFDGPHATPPLHKQGAAVFLGIREITDDGNINLSEARWVSEGDYAKWTKRVTPRAGDIVFTYEATLNRYALIRDGLPCCLGRRTALIRPDPEKVNPIFLFHYLFSPEWRSQIDANTVAGATVDRISLTKFPEFQVKLPPLEVQNRIADTLSTYDDLIENLGRQQQCLIADKEILLPKLMSGQLDVSGIPLPVEIGT